MSRPRKKSPQDSFRLMVDTASCAIVILRQDRTICFFNRCAQRLTGYDADDVQGRDYPQLFLDEASRPRFGRTIEQALSGEVRGESCETAIRCADGGPRWLEWSVQPLDDFEGLPGLLLVGHDITSRIEATEELRSQEARLRAVLDAAADGIITIDQHGIIQSVNSAAESIFGYQAEEMAGRNISMLMPPPYRDEHDQYLARYLRTGEKRIIGIGREVQGQRKDGSLFPCDIAVSEVPLPDQRLFTGIVRDITKQSRAEQRALQAERLAAIGQTITGLAHESRNAFQRSQASLEMLAMELEGRPSELELVARTQRALDHLHRLYEEVRDYAAPINLDRQPCDLAHLWRDAWAQLELSRKDKAVELKEPGGGGELICHADWFAMGQVFRNILENAITACPDPGQVEVRWKTTELEGQPACEIVIQDNGPGIPAAERQQVFEAFFTTRPKGTGLGMAITRRIVEAHGGRIEVGGASPGAQFVITLPLE